MNAMCKVKFTKFGIIYNQIIDVCMHTCTNMNISACGDFSVKAMFNNEQYVCLKTKNTNKKWCKQKKNSSQGKYLSLMHR